VRGEGEDEDEDEDADEDEAICDHNIKHDLHPNTQTRIPAFQHSHFQLLLGHRKLCHGHSLPRVPQRQESGGVRSQGSQGQEQSSLLTRHEDVTTTTTTTTTEHSIRPSYSSIHAVSSHLLSSPTPKNLVISLLNCLKKAAYTLATSQLPACENSSPL